LLEKCGILNFSNNGVCFAFSLLLLLLLLLPREKKRRRGFRARARPFLSLSRRLEQRGVLTPLRENRIIDRIVASLFLFLF